MDWKINVFGSPFNLLSGALALIDLTIAFYYAIKISSVKNSEQLTGMEHGINTMLPTSFGILFFTLFAPLVSGIRAGLSASRASTSDPRVILVGLIQWLMPITFYGALSLFFLIVWYFLRALHRMKMEKQNQKLKKIGTLHLTLLSISLLIWIVITGFVVFRIHIPMSDRAVYRNPYPYKANPTKEVFILQQIIKREKLYFSRTGSYIGFDYGKDCPEISFVQPKGKFIYSFTIADSTAMAMENGVANDVNFDRDGNDGLTLSVNYDLGIISGSSGDDIFW